MNAHKTAVWGVAFLRPHDMRQNPLITSCEYIIDIKPPQYVDKSKNIFLLHFNLDINECTQNGGLGSCISPATCQNEVGSFRCECPSGYRLNANGLTCAGTII